MSRQDTRLIGCSVASLLGLILVVGAAKLFQNGWGRYQAWREDLEAWNELDQTWRPPLRTNGFNAWFPTNIPPFELQTVESNATVSWLDPGQRGWSGLYLDGQEKIDLIVLEAGPDAREGIYRQAERMVKEFMSQDGVAVHRSMYRIQRRFAYRVGPPYEQGLLWWESNHVFLVRSASEIDLKGFLLGYLRLLDGSEVVRDPN